MSIIENLYKKSPNVIQNLMVSIFNVLAYRKRYGGEYKNYREQFLNRNFLSLEELKNEQRQSYEKLIDYAVSHSKYYRDSIGGIKNVRDINNIHQLPVVSKEDIRSNIHDIYTINKSEGIISKTGGTTGKSLEVCYTHENMQERFALLDNFRAKFGYEFGKKTAWFSGKALLTARDIKKNRFWKTDFFHKVRYYSTFHIKEVNLNYYINNLIEYQPEYLVGFPSTIYELAKYGLRNNIQYPEDSIKAVFPTAETLSVEMRKVISTFFKTKVYDQYASSEGAPFIFECELGNKHLELQSGVFEVLDDNNQSSQSGRLIVTSFTTYGTPLIRYDIGDSIILSNKVCSCGNNNPIVAEILGRIDDYVYSPEVGKINLGNVSNTLKDTKGIIKFNVIQNSLDSLELNVVFDEKKYSKSVEEKFIQNWRDRIGDKMKLEINYVENIMSEKSGKFRMVKNNIKHLLDL